MKGISIQHFFFGWLISDFFYFHINIYIYTKSVGYWETIWSSIPSSNDLVLFPTEGNQRPHTQNRPFCSLHFVHNYVLIVSNVNKERHQPYWKQNKSGEQVYPKPRFVSPGLDHGSTTSSSHSAISASQYMISSHDRLEVKVSTKFHHGGSARSTRLWSFTMLRMMSLRCSLEKTSTALPRAFRSRDSLLSRILMIHS